MQTFLPVHILCVVWTAHCEPLCTPKCDTVFAAECATRKTVESSQAKSSTLKRSFPHVHRLPSLCWHLCWHGMDTTLSTISCGSILEMLPLPLHCWIPGVLYIIDCRNKKPAVNCVKISHHHHHQLHRTPSSETSSEMPSAVAYRSQLSQPETKQQCFRKLMCECGKIPGKSSKPSGIAHRVLQNHTPPWHSS